LAMPVIEAVFIRPETRQASLWAGTFFGQDIPGGRICQRCRGWPGGRCLVAAGFAAPASGPVGARASGYRRARLTACPGRLFTTP